MAKTIENATRLQGLFPALLTPLRDNDARRLYNSIDYVKAGQIIDDLIEAGVNGIVPVGTTGQSATLTPAQHMEFIKFALDYAGDRVPVIAGAGSNCTRESVETIDHIIKVAGPITFLCVTGYYNNPPQEGLVGHFETLVKETGAKIIMYNVPSRTNSYLEPETVIHLAANPNIIGLKQAVDFKSPGKWREDTLQIMAGVKDLDFSVISGEDDALFAILEIGGTGMISATGNIPEAARLFLAEMAAFEAGDRQKAEKLQVEADKFVKACFIRKNPIPLAAMFNSPVFQPLVNVRETSGGEEAHQKLMALIDEAAPSLKKYHRS